MTTTKADSNIDDDTDDDLVEAMIKMNDAERMIESSDDIVHGNDLHEIADINDNCDDHDDDNDDNDDDDIDDDMIYNVSSTDSTVPVGITIAYHKRYVAATAATTAATTATVTGTTTTRIDMDHNNNDVISNTWNDTDGKKRIHNKSPSPHTNKRSKRKNHPKQQSKDSQHSKNKWSIPVHKSVQVLLDSSLIYILCIIIPPIMAFLYHTIMTVSSRQEVRTSATNHILPKSGSSSSSIDNESLLHHTSLSPSLSLYYYQSILDPWFEYFNEFDSYRYIKSSMYKPTIHYLCTKPINSVSSDSSSSSSSSYSYYTSYIWSSVLEHTGLCPLEYLHPQRRRSVISDDMSIYMDVLHVTICSFLFAMVRMMIVHYTIFFKHNNSNNNTIQNDDGNGNNNVNVTSNVDVLTILVRCKSNHLLSSDYYLVTSTPDHSSHNQRRVKEMSLDDINQCMVTNLNEIEKRDTRVVSSSGTNNAPNLLNKINNNENDGSSTVETFGYHMDISDHNTNSNNDNEILLRSESEHRLLEDMDSDSSTILRVNPLAIGIPTNSTFNNDHVQSFQANISETNEGHDAKQSYIVQRDDTIIPDDYNGNEVVMNIDELDHQLQVQKQQREHRKLIYAAPRYATAIFRLLYCTITAGIALLYFRHADFWPWFVFGTGRGTKQCWDLSGGITVGGMDSDFDQHNAVLKRYFLWQASYHIHSTTFHFILSMVFLFYPFAASKTAISNNDDGVQPSTPSKRLRGIKKGSYAYIRSFIQHLLSLMLIAVAYIFSSLRRLGAIGLFAFDVSSWSLHLLQICINAPDDSYLWKLLPIKYQSDRESFIRGLHLFVVIPSFIVARLMIWPALWYSAAYESQSWLQQLELTLWPGSALLLRIIIHSMMLILHGISLLYLRRLLFHRLFSK